MRSMRVLGTAVVLFFGVVITEAGAEESVDKGRELFNSTALGKNGKSCAACHPGGKKLEWAATFDDEKLAGVINRCIKQALKGNPLPADSDELKSLVLYLKTFAGPGN